MKRRLGYLLLGGVALLAVVGLVGYLAMEPLLATWLENRLRRDGVHCDHVGIELDASLSVARLDPLTCEFEEGNLSEVELARGAELQLDGFRVSAITMPRVRQVERRPLIDDPDSFTRAVLGGEVPSKLREVLGDLARLSAEQDVPEIHVDSLRSRYRDKRVRLSQLDLTRNEEGELEVHIARVAPEQEPEGGLVQISGEFTNLRATARPDESELRGRLEIDWSLGPIDGDHNLQFRFRGEQLDTEQAHYRVELDPTPVVAELQRLFDDVGEGLENIGNRIEEMAEEISGEQEGETNPS